jgi:hypothetical protein
MREISGKNDTAENYPIAPLVAQGSVFHTFSLQNPSKNCVKKKWIFCSTVI